MKNILKKIQYISLMLICLAAGFLSTSLSVPVLNAQNEDLLNWNFGNDDQPQINVDKKIRWLTEEIDRREAIYKKDKRCSHAGKSLIAFIKSVSALGNALEALTPFYNDRIRKIRSHLDSFDKLDEEFRVLKAQAASAGALVPDHIWKQHKQQRGHGILIPQVLAKDPALVAKIAVFREMEGKIAIKWIDALKLYRKDVETELEAANKKKEKKLTGLAALYQKHNEFSKQIREMFNSGEYAPCLGEIASMGLHYGGEFSDPSIMGTKLTDIPGIAFEFPGLTTIKEKYKPFTAPAERGVPPTLHYYKDPGKAPQRYAERAEAKLKGERYGLIVDGLNAPIYFLQVASQLAIWNVATSVTQPLNHALWESQQQPWHEVLLKLGKAYTYDTLVATLKPAVELIDEGVNGFDSAGRSVVDGLEQVVNNPKETLAAMKNIFHAADEGLGKIQAALDGANPMHDPEKPNSNASADEWLRYMDKLKARTAATKTAHKQVNAAVEKFKHVVDDGNRILQVYLAIVSAGKAYEAGGNLGLITHMTGTDILDRPFKRLMKKKLRAKLAIKDWKNAQKIKNSKPKLDKPTRELVDDYSDLDKVNEKLKNQEKLNKRIEQTEQQTLDDINTPKPPKGKKTKVENTIDVKDEDGNTIATLDEGELLGKGGGSSAYENAQNDATVIRKTTLTPVGKSAHLHDEIGRDFLEKNLPDSNVIRVAKREATYTSTGELLDPDSPFLGKNADTYIEINENLSEKRGFVQVKKGKPLTKGQRLAIEGAHREINRHGGAWLDNTDANFRMEKMSGEDRWRVVVLDTGGIYKVSGGADAAARVQKKFNNKIAEVKNLSRNEAVRQVWNEIKNDGIQLPEGETLAAFSPTGERTGTGLVDITGEEINTQLRDKEADALNEELNNNKEYLTEKERLQKERQADQKARDRLQEIADEIEKDKKHANPLGDNEKPPEGELHGEAPDLLDDMPDDQFGGMKLPEIDFNNLGTGDMLY